MLFTPRTKESFSTKFLPRWVGPYKIIAKMGTLTYRIMKIDGKKNVVVHVQRLRKYQPWPKTSEFLISVKC